MPSIESTKRQKAAYRSTMVSVVVNIALTTLQLTIGIFSKSSALVADAIHSLSDLVSDGVVLIANKHSNVPADDDHPYGHHRFETAASMFIGAILISVGISILWSGLLKLQEPSSIPVVHHFALYVALFAVLAKELLFRYLISVAKKFNSTMLAANAWHARSDAFSSIVVSIGIVANLAGFPLADPLAAILVGLIIGRMGWSFFYDAIQDLVDRAADDKTESRIKNIILTTPGVLGLHDLKTRKMGDMLWVEVDIEMDGKLTIEQGHDIATEARIRVMAKEKVLNMTTHFDPVTPKTSIEENQGHIRSFVNRRSHITPSQQNAIDSLLPKWSIKYESNIIDLSRFFNNNNDIVLEIGFGMGDATAKIAMARPDDNFLGVEVYNAGVGSLLNRIQQNDIKNIRIIQHDAFEVLRDMIAPNSLAGVHIYFPDPWPKKRHHKRRLIQPEFVKLLCSKIKPNGYIHCATDWENYAQQMLNVFSNEPCLINKHDSYAPRPEYRPITKFEQRGIKLGHGVWDLIFTRVEK